MVKVKPMAEIDQAYREGAGRAPANYKKGIERTNDWQAKASSEDAEQLYGQKVQEAVAAKRRQKAVQGVSDAEWKAKAAGQGASRIGQGMMAGADKRARNYQPYHSALESLTLPPKTADPLANVDNRVKGVVKAMVDTKKQIKG